MGQFERPAFKIDLPRMVVIAQVVKNAKGSPH